MSHFYIFFNINLKTCFATTKSHSAALEHTATLKSDWLTGKLKLGEGGELKRGES